MFWNWKTKEFVQEAEKRKVDVHTPASEKCVNKMALTWDQSDAERQKLRGNKTLMEKKNELKSN